MNLTADIQANIKAIIDALKAKGITNTFYHAAILGIVQKESGLKPRTEGSYRNTSPARIRAVFPSRLGKMSDAEINALKVNDAKFFEAVYGGKYGNPPGQAAKFIGRGYNQVTFLENYRAASKHAGVDLLANPELLNKPEIAARALVGYFLDTINTKRLAEYGLKSLNDIRDITTAVRIAMRQNAGWGSSTAGTVFREGEAKALEFAKQIASTVVKHVSENKGTYIIGLILLAGSATAYLCREKIKALLKKILPL